MRKTAHHQRLDARQATAAENIQTDFSIADPFKRIKTRKLGVSVREPYVTRGGGDARGLVGVDVPIYLKPVDPMGFAIRVPDYVGAMFAGDVQDAERARYVGSRRFTHGNADKTIEKYKGAYIIVRNTDEEVTQAFTAMQEEYAEQRRALQIEFAKFIEIEISGQLEDAKGNQVLSEGGHYSHGSAQTLSIEFNVTHMDNRDFERFEAWKRELVADKRDLKSWRATKYKITKDGDFERDGDIHLNRSDVIRSDFEHGFHTVVPHSAEMEAALILIETGLVKAGRRLIELFRRDDFDTHLIGLFNANKLPALELMK